jgi:hypothetical protein
MATTIERASRMARDDLARMFARWYEVVRPTPGKRY